MKRLLIALIGLSLTACSGLGGKPDANYANYLAAHQADAANHKQSVPLVEIEAQPGQQITLGGVKSFRVSMPAQQGPGVQQMVQQPSEAVEIVKAVMPAVGTVGGIWAAGRAAQGLATAVGNVAKTPQANVTTDNHSLVSTTATDYHGVALDSHAVTATPATTVPMK